jgi:hypothetical protein
MVTNMTSDGGLIGAASEPVIVQCDRLIDQVCLRFKQEVEIGGLRVKVISDEHPARMSKFAVQLAWTAGMRGQELQEFAAALPLHDAGKAHPDVNPKYRANLGRVLGDQERKDFREEHSNKGPEVIDRLESVVGFQGLPMNIGLAKEICRFHHPEIDDLRGQRCLAVKCACIADKFEGMIGTGDQRSHANGPHRREAAAAKLMRQARDGLLDVGLTMLFIRDCQKLQIKDFN